MEDQHRGACRWPGPETRIGALDWFGLLDWSVYHAPGWVEWQVFRMSLVGQPMPLRRRRIEEWWELSGKGLADAVRCVNVLRSLRGQFREYPELRELLDQLNPELDRLREYVRNRELRRLEM